MEVSKYLRNTAGISIIGLSLAGAYLVSKFSEKPTIVIKKQQSSLNVNNSLLKYFSLGQKRLYSSLFWVATILESDHDHYKGKDLNSWMFLRFMTISNLEPKFLMTYTFGGPYLSIIKDDLEGASIIYDKGLLTYPNEFQLLNSAAFHYQFEKINYEKSYEIYKKLSTFPQSKTTQISQLARLESEKGNLHQAFTLLSNLYDKISDKDSYLAKRITFFLYSIRTEIDLNCLNSNNKKDNCSYFDLYGEPYEKIDGRYFTKKAWSPFRVRAPKN